MGEIELFVDTSVSPNNLANMSCNYFIILLLLLLFETGPQCKVERDWLPPY